MQDPCPAAMMIITLLPPKEDTLGGFVQKSSLMQLLVDMEFCYCDDK